MKPKRTLKEEIERARLFFGDQTVLELIETLKLVNLTPSTGELIRALDEIETAKGESNEDS